MLKQAVAYYHELLQDFDLAESSRQALDEGLESAKLIFGGRRLAPYLAPAFRYAIRLESDDGDLRNDLERLAESKKTPPSKTTSC